MAKLANRDDIYAAIDSWKRNCLLADGSVFGETAVWTGAHAAELITHFVDNPDTGDRNFEEKLKDQLASTSVGARQLAAEMFWLMMLFPSNIGEERKRESIQTLWGWSGTPLASSHPSLRPLATGIGSGGSGYNMYRPFELQLVVRFTAEWKALPVDQRDRLVNDAWAFAEWWDRLPNGPSRQIRHMLLHLMFPDDFERVSSTGDKKRIDKTFKAPFSGGPIAVAELGPSALARDRRIRRIRRTLEASRPRETLDFYSTPDLRARWQDSPAPPSGSAAAGQSPAVVREVLVTEPVDERRARAWVIGAGEGAARWPSFLEHEFVAIGWDELGNLGQYTTREDIQETIRRVYSREQDPWNDSLACFQFCREMAVGDTVYVKQGRNRILGYGRVVGAYEHLLTVPDFRNIRRMEWIRSGNWTLPDAAFVPTKTLTDVTEQRAFLAYMAEQFTTVGPSSDAPAPYSVDDVMRDAFLPRTRVEAILASFRRRKNVILQGPPGVGKSFLARRLAYALVGAESPDNVRTVQFHQSYAYEDFIQGWRPCADGFERRDGPFYEFCRRAQSNPTEPHVFVIDEINRGNLSKVFGELMLLIETDKRGPANAIPLTYSVNATDTFFVPENVYMIGLMNTADRSLAMVDYALRRRFAFFTLEPTFDSPAFRQHLLAQGVDDATVTRIVDRVGVVNRKIAEEKNLGTGFIIGHSYFCPTSNVADAASWYEAVVTEEIQPLLDEYWFDNAKRVEECVDTLRS